MVIPKNKLSGVSLTPTWGVPQSATVGHHRRGWGHADGVGDVPFGTVLSRSQHVYNIAKYYLHVEEYIQ
ncbi:hypothetical protein T08_13259 [Trichinella sp. T8]|nr:hypothetical protein T08_13259 [Trichinella sp. T8]